MFQPSPLPVERRPEQQQRKAHQVASTKAKGNGETKGAPRPQAARTELDFTAIAAEDSLKTQTNRSSKWKDLLDKLYDATAEGKVPRDESGKLVFLDLGTFQNAGGARTQVAIFEKAGYDGTYEFKTVVKGKSSTIWARVKEVEDAPAPA